MSEENAAPNPDTGNTIVTNPPVTPPTDTWVPPDWAKDAPAELHPMLKAKNYATPVDVLKAYAEAQKVISADKVPLPKDGQWDAESRKKLGIPETAEGYQLEKPQLPEGMAWDEKFEKALIPVAHQAGLTPRQLQTLMGAYAEYQKGQFEALGASVKQAREQVESTLRQEFGGQFDAKVSMAKRVVQQLGGEELVRALDETGFGNNPALVKFAAKIGSMMAEDTLKSGANTGFGMGVEEAKTEIARLEANPIYMDKYHAERPALMKKRDELYKIAFPNKAA